MRHITRNKINFTILPNDFLRDDTISLRAKGMLGILLSLPDTWRFSISGLAAICKEGKYAVSTALRELEKAGYLRKTITFGGKCHIESRYDIYDTPTASQEKSTEQKHKKKSKNKSNEYDENRTTVGIFSSPNNSYTKKSSAKNSSAKNCAVINKDKIKTNKINKNKRKKETDSLLSDKSAPLQQALTDYREMRDERSKPISKLSMKLILDKLNNMSKDESVQAEIVNQSTRNGWSSFFMPKGRYTPHKAATTMKFDKNPSEIELQFMRNYTVM